jgi:ABC-type antimicrobial peptide transport system permease subunit
MKIFNFERKNILIFVVLILLLIFRFFTSWYAPFGEDQYLIYVKALRL